MSVTVLPVATRPPGRVRPVSQASREVALATVVLVGAGAVLAMWLQDTSAGSLRSLADELTAAGRLTGLLGGYLVLVEVLLLARIPWLDRMVGMDRLVVWHRRNGEYVVVLLVVHALATIAGYGLSDHRGVVPEAATVVLHYPDVLAATVALGLLVAVGVLSARTVRRRMAYHTWYFLHLYTYLAVVLAFAHQFATGDDFVGHPGHRALWAALHGGTAALLIGYRVVAPLRFDRRHRLVVARVAGEAPGVVSLYISGRELDAVAAAPGQFFFWRFLTRQGWWQAHPFSLSAAPNGQFLRITVKNAGDHSAFLQRVRPGTRVIAEGPYGGLTERRRTRPRVLLVAGGIGAAPLRALFESLPAGPGELTFLACASRPEDFVFWSELQELARQRAARLGYVMGARGIPNDPLRPEALRATIPGLEDHDVYVCGPPAFVDHVLASMRDAGVPRRRLHTERFEL